MFGRLKIWFALTSWRRLYHEEPNFLSSLDHILCKFQSSKILLKKRKKKNFTAKTFWKNKKWMHQHMASLIYKSKTAIWCSETWPVSCGAHAGHTRSVPAVSFSSPAPTSFRISSLLRYHSKIGVGKIFFFFFWERSLLCSPRLN